MQILKIIVGILVLVNVGTAQSSFKLSDDEKIAAKLDGKTFISKISFDLSSHEYSGMIDGSDTVLESAEESCFDVKKTDTDIKVYSGVSSFDVPWTCEVSAKDDRLEINFVANFPPKDYGEKATHSRLKIYVPVAQLSDCDLKYVLGRVVSSEKRRKGKLTGLEKSSETPIYGHARYIKFSNRRDLFFDICPTGAGDMFGTAPLTGYKGHIMRDGDNYVFIIPTYRIRWGGKMVSKIVLRNGVYGIDKIHPIHRYHYTFSMPSLMRFAFTGNEPAEGFGTIAVKGWNSKFVGCKTHTYDKNKGYGWLKNDNLRIINSAHNDNMGPLLSNGVEGNGSATFKFKHPNARVLTTLVFSGAAGKDFVVEVKANDSKPIRVTVVKNRKSTVLVPTVIRNGIVDVTIKGDAWMLSAIIPSFIMGMEEDFQFDRNWWVSGKDPWNLKQFKDKALWSSWPDKFFCDAKWKF